MQKFGYVSDEGTVQQWLKSEGEAVKEGEPLANVETEKALAELTAPASGILYKILVPEGETVRVGTSIAIIAEPGEEVPDITEITRETTVQVSEEEREAPAVGTASWRERSGRPIMASPAARSLGREYGIDLRGVEGTGPEGSVTKEDVMMLIEKNEREEIIPLSGFRKAMAERLARSAKTYAHITTTWEVDVTTLLELRNKLKQEWAKQGVRVTLTAFLIKGVAETLKDVPLLNSSFDGAKIIVKKYYNIGVATSVEDSRGGGREDRLVVPVVKDADKKNLVEVARSLGELVEKARLNSLTREDVSDGTFTISNTGPLGAAGAFTSIINPPESAILGIGSVIDKPVAQNGKIVVRATAPICLTYDHRIILPTHSARFRTRLKELLENPEMLLRSDRRSQASQ